MNDLGQCPSVHAAWQAARLGQQKRKPGESASSQPGMAAEGLRRALSSDEEEAIRVANARAWTKAEPSEQQSVRAKAIASALSAYGAGRGEGSLSKCVAALRELSATFLPLRALNDECIPGLLLELSSSTEADEGASNLASSILDQLRAAFLEHTSALLNS